MLKKLYVITLLLALCLLCGCGGADSKPTVPDGTSVSFSLPWEDPVDLTLTFNDAEVIYLQFGDDALAEEDWSAEPVLHEGETSILKIRLWENEYTVWTENGAVVRYAEKGSWKDIYDENWESIQDPDAAFYRAEGIYENTFSADGELLSTGSDAEYICPPTGEHWRKVYSDTLENGVRVCSETFVTHDNDAWEREITYYDGDTVTERQVSGLYSEYDEATSSFSWYRSVSIDHRVPAEGNPVYDWETVSTGRKQELRMYLGNTHYAIPTAEILDENASFTRAELNEDIYAYDPDNGEWTDIRRSFAGTANRTADFEETFRSIESAAAASRASVEAENDVVYSLGTNSGKGWRWNKNCGIPAVCEQLLADGDLVAAAVYGEKMARGGMKHEAIEYLQRVYDAGEIYAAESLGVVNCFYLKDFDTGTEWYQKAIDAGSARAIFRLGNNYDYVGNYKKAMELYLAAYDAGYTRAASYIGANYSIFYNSPKEAEKWLMLQYDAPDNNSALFNLAYIYSQRGDYKKASEVYLKAGSVYLAADVYAEYARDYTTARDIVLEHPNEMRPDDEAELLERIYAQLHDAQSASRLGTLYTAYAILDPEKSAAWFTKAYDAGDISAAVDLGWLCWNSLNKPEKAAEWFQIAWDNGYVDGAVGLGYYSGDVLQDLEQALEWFHKAYDGGYAAAARYSGRAYEKMGDTQNAEKWYRIAYDNSVEFAATYLGELYDFVLNDNEQAIEWYQKAVDSGEMIAALRLGILYKDELNDQETGRRWLRFALNTGVWEAEQYLN